MTMRIGTPDDTYGIVAATQLLAVMAHGSPPVTVTPPPNTQTLLLFTDQEFDGTITVAGGTSGYDWPVFPFSGVAFNGKSNVFVVPVNTAIDTTYTITATIPNLKRLYIAAEQGIRAIADCTLQSLLTAPGQGGINAGILSYGLADGTLSYPIAVNQLGKQYVVQAPPDPLDEGDLLNEIQYKNIDAKSANTVILAAPGVGQFLRIFYIEPYPNNATAVYNVSATIGGATVFFGRTDIAGRVPPPSRLPITGALLDSNTALTLNVSAGSAGVTVGWQIY